MKDIKIFNAVRYENDDISKVASMLNRADNFISGSANLTQRVLKLFLTDVGSNKYVPNFGSYSKDLQIVSSSSKDKERIRTMLNTVLSQVENYIKTEQTNYNLSNNELLDKLEILDILFNKDTNSWKFRISIKNQLGELSILEIN